MARLGVLAALLLLTLVAAPAQAAGRDRVPAEWQKRFHLAPAAARKDLDRDGLGTYAEWRSRTSPRKADSDGDRRPDGREDRDRDGLTNAFEGVARTDPGKADSDGDRRRDGREDADRDGLDHAAEARYGYAPRRRDSDGDGIRDGDEHPGVVRSVAGSVVTIALARGGTLVAGLRADTEVGCQAPVDAGATDDGASDAPDPGAEDLVEEGDDAGGEDDPVAGDDDGGEGLEPVADAAQAEEPGAELDAEDPLDDSLSEGDGCATTVRPGALVHAAVVVAGPSGLGLTVLELLGATG